MLLYTKHDNFVFTSYTLQRPFKSVFYDSHIFVYLYPNVYIAVDLTYFTYYLFVHLIS